MRHQGKHDFPHTAESLQTFAPAFAGVMGGAVNARGSVSRVLSTQLPALCDHSSRPAVTNRLKQPTRMTGRRMPCAIPIRSCSRWGLPCRFCCQTRGALLPHRFDLTIPKNGGLFSVALSLGSPQPGIIRHRSSLEPGLSSPAQLPAQQRSPNPLAATP